MLALKKMTALNKHNKFMLSMIVLNSLLDKYYEVHVRHFVKPRTLSITERQILNALRNDMKSHLADKVSYTDMSNTIYNHTTMSYSMSKRVVVYKECAEYMKSDEMVKLFGYSSELFAKIILQEARRLSDYLKAISVKNYLGYNIDVDM